MAKDRKAARKPRRERKNVPQAVANIHATFNNTIVTFTDPSGMTLCWSSGGRIGYKGSRKGTPVRRSAGRQERRRAGAGARRAQRATSASRVPDRGASRRFERVAAAGLEIRSIRDVTPIPHNGCRPRKRRRV